MPWGSAILLASVVTPPSGDTWKTLPTWNPPLTKTVPSGAATMWVRLYWPRGSRVTSPNAPSRPRRKSSPLDVERAVVVERDALGIGHLAGERRDSPLRRHLEDAPDMESSADEDRSVRRRHHVGAVVLATRESRDEPERAVAAEAEELAARREKHGVVGGERHQGGHVRQRAPARPATPGAGEQRCQVPEAARQRDCRVEEI